VLDKHEQKHKEGKSYISGRFVTKVDFPCDKCNKSFKNQHNLDRHIRSHLGIRSFACNVCGNKFVDATRLKQHMWIHAGYRAFKCAVCKKEFRHKSHLKSHISSFHPELKGKLVDSFKCNLCDKSFPYQYKLNNHMSWHAAQEVSTIVKSKPSECTKIYMCSLCQTQFQNIDDLNIHCELHTKEPEVMEDQTVENITLNNGMIIVTPYDQLNSAEKNNVFEVDEQNVTLVSSEDEFLLPTHLPKESLVTVQNNQVQVEVKEHPETLIVSDDGHEIFELPDNIHVGDTMHIDEHGHVQVVKYSQS
jgi:DNA-directed RNA polymerase subunit RPC12/RpoP